MQYQTAFIQYEYNYLSMRIHCVEYSQVLDGGDSSETINFA